jgi:hypothetical protein
VQKRFPAGSYDPIWTSYKKASSPTATIGNVPIIGFLMTLAPFYEQQAIYDAVAAECAKYAAMNPDPADYNPVHPGNGAVYRDAVITALRCPSDANAYVKGADLARTSYHGCWGDIMCNDTMSGTQYTGVDNASFVRGVLTRGDYIKVDSGSILDGTSNTIAVSESLCGLNSNEFETKYRIGVIQLLDNKFTPKDCLGKKGTGGEVDTSVANMTGGRKGCRWASGQMGYSGFHTILPPNSPSCATANSATFTDWIVERYGLISASSNHSGGAVVGMLDGSCRFVSETIDCGNDFNQSLKNTFSKKSPFGIWGAAGTINGAESTTLP